MHSRFVRGLHIPQRAAARAWARPARTRMLLLLPGQRPASHVPVLQAQTKLNLYSGALFSTMSCLPAFMYTICCRIVIWPKDLHIRHVADSQ